MDPENYQHYLAEDFAKDAAFIRWVKYSAPEDEAFWKTFVLAHPHQAVETDQARALILDTLNLFPVAQLSDEEKSQMHVRLMGAIRISGQTGVMSGLLQLRPARWAAVVGLLILCGVAFYTLTGAPDQEKYTTSFGETRTLSLPDGSIVRLNANSQLTFDAAWQAGNDRQVWLEGEAYFEVSPQPETCAKFSVHTHELVVQVLGTRFNVNSRQAKTRVVLNEGKISLLLHEPGSESIRMDPGDMVDYAQKQRKLVQRKVNPELHSSWKEGIQLFEKTSLGEVIEKMEEIYGVAIQVQDTSLASRKITMGVPVEDFGIAMETIESVLGLKISPIDAETYLVH